MPDSTDHRVSQPQGTRPQVSITSYQNTKTANHTAVAGLQWGDEGKGKIVDWSCRDHDVIIRYNGGANAGHTVIIGSERFAQHLLPSGILSPDKLNVIANGVVVDPQLLVDECDHLIERGITIGDNLRLSNRAHVVMPWHKAIDEALEYALSGSLNKHETSDTNDHSLGTTKRGIGPAYADKATRATAIRAGDLLDPDHLADRFRVISPIKLAQLQSLTGDQSPIDTSIFDADELTQTYHNLGQRLKPHITDTMYLLHEANESGKRFLFEGANAGLLDIDHGTWPYVTSSNCSALGIHAGTGLPGRTVQNVLGVMKAYCTRVGAGPFPTQLNDEIGDRIRDRGKEYGTTTGRPRRCGWLDLVATRYSAMLSGATSLAVMLFDVLAGFDEIKICTAYKIDGKQTDRFLPDARQLSRVQPVYEILPGYEDDVTDARSRNDLSKNAKAYLDFIEQHLNIPIKVVSVGPERSQTIPMK